MNTKFQEGRTYLWIYDYTEFDADIVTGEMDSDLLRADNGELYESVAGPLTQTEYNKATYLIESRDWFLEARIQATTDAEYLASKLHDLWRGAR